MPFLAKIPSRSSALFPRVGLTRPVLCGIPQINAIRFFSCCTLCGFPVFRPISLSLSLSLPALFPVSVVPLGFHGISNSLSNKIIHIQKQIDGRGSSPDPIHDVMLSAPPKV